MHAEANSYENAIDESELVRMVGTLQDELRSMRSQVRELAHQRVEPSQEVDAHWSRQGDGHWKSESQRVIDEVSQLMQQYEAATDATPTASHSAELRPARSSSPHVSPSRLPRRRSARSARPCSRRRVARGSKGPEVGPDFFKKMFMFMMSELA